MKFLRKSIYAAIILLFLMFVDGLSLNVVKAAEETSLPVYYVRFSEQGLPIYQEPALLTPIAILCDDTYVQIVLGPLDSLVKIRIYGTEIEGYTDVKYLKKLDAIVYDYDIYTYEEMEEDILLLYAKYPTLLRVDTAGTSADGRNLYTLTIGNENASKHILIHAGLHAREYINTLLVMEQLEQCLDYYDTGYYHNQSYRELFSSVAVHIIPMVNPDGIAISQFGESALRSSELVEIVRACYAYDSAMRRTKSSYERYLARWKANARGVDLNKNFPVGFVFDGTVSQPSYAGYAGEFPLSEPESLSLGAVTLLYQPSIIINYHSMGEVAYWDTSESKYTAINREFSTYMLSFVPYKRMGRGSASGSYLDWIYSGETPVRSITLETGNVACPLPPDQYPKIWLQHNMVVQAAVWYAYAGI